MEVVVSPNITVLQRSENDLKKPQTPNPETRPLAQVQTEVVVKGKKKRGQKQKRVAEEPRRPITRAYARALLEAQNNVADGSNLRNEEVSGNPEGTSERENPESLPMSEPKDDVNMETEANMNNASGQNPGPNGGTWQHQPNPRFIPHHGRVQYDSCCEIAALRHQLQASQNHQNELYWKLVAANKRASYYQSKVTKLHAQMIADKKQHEETIKELIEQLEEANDNNKPDKSKTEVQAKDNQAVVMLDDMIRVLHEDVSDPTTEQCVDSSTQTTEASHTDCVGLKEAQFEVQYKTQQEQIGTLQQQLLEAQHQLKEQEDKHRQDQETLNMEISELKSQLCSNKELHDMKVETLYQELKEVKASYIKITQEQNEQNSNTANGKSELLVEKDTKEQDKEEEEDSLTSTEMSLHDSLQQTEDREKTITTNPAELETEAKTVPEKKPKKKKRNWLRRLFSCTSPQTD